MYRMRYNLHRVSIHATLAGGDDTGMTIAFHARGFYPRHPRGWRRPGPASRWRSSWFLSTPPSRVATKQRPAAGPGQLVSIHATLAGGDNAASMSIFAPPYSFYPRHPRGWRLIRYPLTYNPILVSIHATLAGGDGRFRKLPLIYSQFLSTPPSRVATDCASKVVQYRQCFYPRHPRGWRRRPRSCSRCRPAVSIHATLAGGDRRSKGCYD